MLLTFTIASSEVEDFAMKIKIDAESTFAELHSLILEACGYMDFGVHRFYVCDEDWHPEHRILQSDAGYGADEDIYLMGETALEELLEDEGQRMAYRFDPESRRLLLMEVSKTSFGESLDEPIVKMRGQAPSQMLMEEEETPAPAVNTGNEELEESFYGDDGYEEDELDEEGFDVIEQ